jgi:transcription termination/antitermination protein NusA
VVLPKELRTLVYKEIVNITEVISQLVEEKDISAEVLIETVCEGMLVAYQKKYPNLVLKVEVDKGRSKLLVLVQKKIVATVADEDREISLRKARAHSPSYELDQEVWFPFEGTIGRVEVLKARQVIASKIKMLESRVIWEAFKDKEGTIVHGYIHKREQNGILVKIQDVLAFLPGSLSVPGEKYIPGHPIKALLKEVLPEPRGENQLILDRASSEFLAELFELEVPEVFDSLVEIKKIVRIAGYKSKIAVASHDDNVDPVGTCVGVGGARIRPILKEIGGEKIDIVQWSDSLEEFVQDALKPAKVNRVEVMDNRARVWVDEDQRSMAIGRLGQNISLASRLTGIDIDIAENAGDVSIVD